MYSEKINFTEVNTYGNHPTDEDDVYTVQEFKRYCNEGLFIDYDGDGYPVKDGFADTNILIKPSRLGQIPDDATHIVWYNR